MHDHEHDSKRGRRYGHEGEHGHGGGFGHGHGMGHGGYCICPQCGYSEVHIAGVPCRTVVCPTCQIPLVRSEEPQLNETDSKLHHLSVSSEKEQEKLKIFHKSPKSVQIFPQVIPERCLACGRCINVCPMSTIVMKDGAAFVNQENCKSCFVCMRVCPTDAFVKVEI